MDVVKHFYNKIPILGICLGHQCIGEVVRRNRELCEDAIPWKTVRSHTLPGRCFYRNRHAG